MSLNVRGKDHNPRESRGPPSKKAKDTRSNNLIKSNKKSAVEGHRNLFQTQQLSQFESKIPQNVLGAVVFASAAGTIQNNIGEIPIPSIQIQQFHKFYSRMT